MDNTISIELAKQIMGCNFIGPNELKSIKEMKFRLPVSIQLIPFDEETLRKKCKDYFLIYGLSEFEDGRIVNIRNIKSIFGMNTNNHLPCFYFQDWYDKEKFIDTSMQEGWFLIKKSVYKDSRGVQPETLSEKYIFPKAITCTYAFFVAWLVREYKLWYNDFVWCSDKDHNGDRIYVGKYHDIDGINHDGFSIHRYLSIRQCYACIDWK